MRLTVDQVMSYGPCYKADKIEALFAGREAISLHDVAEMDIPGKDKVWLFCQKDVLNTDIEAKWHETIVTRAIKTALAVYNEPSYVKWAENWLNGNDRSVRTAYDAAEAARDAYAAHAAKAAAHVANAAYADRDAAHEAHAVYAISAAAHAANAAAHAISGEYKQQVADLMALLDYS